MWEHVEPTEMAIEDLDLVVPTLVRSDLTIGEHERLPTVETPPYGLHPAQLRSDLQESGKAEEEGRRAAGLEDEFVRPNKHGRFASE